MNSSKLQIALTWAAAGFWVFPCGGDTGKRPLVENGVNDATRDPAQIEAWWTQWPDANIGCDIGRSGYCVIDLDVKERDGKKIDGPTELRKLEAHYGPLPKTLIVMTPSGGFHLWFKGSLRNTSGKLGEGIDTRGRGDNDKPGYVLVPGSVINGHPYKIVSSLTTSESCLDI